MEAAGCCYTLVPMYLIARLHIPLHCPGNGHSSMKSFDP